MQGRWASLFEAFTNTAVSFAQGFLTQLIVFPWFDIHITLTTNAILVCIFLTVSLGRSYFIRRVFNLWGQAR